MNKQGSWSSGMTDFGGGQLSAMDGKTPEIIPFARLLSLIPSDFHVIDIGTQTFSGMTIRNILRL